VTFAVNATGGTGGLALTYRGLPSGCASANVTSFNCTPTVPGTYNVTVVASDYFGVNASAFVHLTVTSTNTSAPGPSGSSGTDWTLWILVGVVVVLVLVVAVLLVRRNRI
jgi:hypothetical protein